MDNFKEKQKAQENKYAFDKEQEFKVVARRNKLLGLWAAEQLHMDEARAAEYAKEVVIADFEEPGDEDVFRKVKGDLEEKGVSIEDEDIRYKMIDLMEVAKAQIAEELGVAPK